MSTRERKKPVKVGEQKSELVRKLPKACSDEVAAVAFMEEQRWNGTACCPRCGDTDVYAMTDASGINRSSRFLWRCRGCKQQFTVRVGTIMEDSPIPLRHWCYAFWAACASKKGVSAKQIQRQTGLSYKSALFLMHRIRWAMAPVNEQTPPLTGTVEADETFVGGKPRRKTYHADGRVRPGPGADFKDRKTPVFAAVERGGKVRTRVITNVTPKSLRRAVEELIDPSARLMTDERPAYRTIGRSRAGGHETVNHGAGEYVRGDVTTNTIEGFFSILKRGVTRNFPRRVEKAPPSLPVGVRVSVQPPGCR